MAGSDSTFTRRAVKLTYDFVHFPDDGKRHELIDGEHDVTPSPNVRHQRISGNLYWLADRFERPLELARDAGDVLTTALLPGPELPLSRIFES